MAWQITRFTNNFLLEIEGHTEAGYFPKPGQPDAWDLSTARAQATRRLLMKHDVRSRSGGSAGMGTPCPSKDCRRMIPATAGSRWSSGPTKAPTNSEAPTPWQRHSNHSSRDPVQLGAIFTGSPVQSVIPRWTSDPWGCPAITCRRRLPQVWGPTHRTSCRASSSPRSMRYPKCLPRRHHPWPVLRGRWRSRG
jgi:hypothetical protein